ncbi:class I SAM-dependent methyltransferase [Devriesea agamarum]|uniref:class I SAM-dependent methyltransferase n=1 Tax=Devriesea agamarum TaxID=472569 RepID=UPI00071E5511|nr:methyltransferase [Devriesea agamarum]
MSDHYFTPQSTAKEQRFPLSVTLAGSRRDLVSSAGVFSAKSLDKATALLLAHEDELPPLPDTGDLLDLGSGWGPIALTLALRRPRCRVWAVDIADRARELTAENAARLGLENVEVCAPEDVPAEIQFHAIWSNPAIRIGKDELHQMLALWLGRLHPDGTASMAVGKNLGADSLMRWLASRDPDRPVNRTASAKGFRILTVGPKARSGPSL